MKKMADKLKRVKVGDVTFAVAGKNFETLTAFVRGETTGNFVIEGLNCHKGCDHDFITTKESAAELAAFARTRLAENHTCGSKVLTFEHMETGDEYKARVWGTTEHSL